MMLMIWVCVICVSIVVPIEGQGQGNQNVPAAAHVPFVAGFTPEVQQARNNFQNAYNYLAELARLAPDDPTTAATVPQAAQVDAGLLQKQVSPAAVQATSPSLPLGYQFGGLTPDVAQATADFFKQYVAAANRANQVAKPVV